LPSAAYRLIDRRQSSVFIETTNVEVSGSSVWDASRSASYSRRRNALQCSLIESKIRRRSHEMNADAGNYNRRSLVFHGAHRGIRKGPFQ
jgi:hypothetical protein